MAHHIHTGLVFGAHIAAIVILLLYGARVLILRYPNNPFSQGLNFILG